MTSGCERANRSKNNDLSVAALRESGAFDGLCEAALEEIVASGAVTRLRPWRELPPQGDGRPELYHFVVEGHVGFAVSPAPGGGEGGNKKGRQAAAEADYLGFFVRGDCFSGAFGATDGGNDSQQGGAATLTCIALSQTVLVGLPTDTVIDLFGRYPDFERLHGRRNAEQRLGFLQQQVPARRLVQSFYLRHGFTVAQRAHVVQLDRCIDCEACETACRERHGQALLSLQGPRLGRVAFAVACRECRDRICTSVCREKAIHFDEVRQRVKIDERCNSCGACAKMCPAGAISVSQDKSAPACKCDGCDGFAEAACTRACPTGALVRLAPDEVFVEQRVPGVAGERPSFCPNAFAFGLDEHRARGRRRSRVPWMALLGTLAIVAVGLECFLRKTMPAHSLAFLMARGGVTADGIQFAAGKGLGHALGYVGSALMLLACLYPLRSRLSVWAWLPKKLCLSLHIWGGLMGAAFVTYHSLLKLDRWPVLSLYATWLVVLSGAVGRYAYGWVHSQVGFAELEEQFFEQERRRLEVAGVQHADAGAAASASGLALWTAVPAMLWRDLGDRAGLIWARIVGLRDMQDTGLRRQALRLIAERARSARRRRYLESAKRLLAVWNRIHLVLTLVMVVIAVLHTVYAIRYSGL